PRANSRPLRNEVTWPDCPHGGAAAGVGRRSVVRSSADCGRGLRGDIRRASERAFVGWLDGIEKFVPFDWADPRHALVILLEKLRPSPAPHPRRRRGADRL